MSKDQAAEIIGLLKGILITVLSIMIFVIFHVIFQTLQARRKP
jgi:hypothetical protein